MLDEKKVVTWALILLFLTLSVVYSLTYMKKTDLFKVSMLPSSGTQIPGLQETGDQTIAVLDFDQASPPVAVQATGNQTRGESFSNTSQTVEHTDPASTTSSLPSSAVVVELLPGTSQYQGSLDIIDVLGSSPDYILQDSRRNYFASYGMKEWDFVGKVQQLGGNVYVMATENEILKNDLFGDKVSFINMLAFKDKWVVMVIEIEGKTRLLQIPAENYHSSKAYLKSLFI